MLFDQYIKWSQPGKLVVFDGIFKQRLKRKRRQIKIHQALFRQNATIQLRRFRLLTGISIFIIKIS